MKIGEGEMDQDTLFEGLAFRDLVPAAHTVRSDMPRYVCAACGGDVELVRAQWPNGEMLTDGSDVWFGCASCGEGTLIEPRPQPVVLSDLDAKQLGPFVRGSETSRKAALANYPRQGSQRQKVLLQVAFMSGTRERGVTRDELADRLGMSPNSVRPRVAELVEGGWVRESGRTRKTPLGRDAAVLEMTEVGSERMAR